MGAFGHLKNGSSGQRTLGVTFLGMMESNEPVPDSSFSNDLADLKSELSKRVFALESRVQELENVWYKRCWRWLRNLKGWYGEND